MCGTVARKWKTVDIFFLDRFKDYKNQRTYYDQNKLE